MLLAAGALLVPTAALCSADPPPEAPSANPATQGKGIDIAVDAGNRVTLPVMVNDKGPYSFFVDTGAQQTILSTELAEALALTAAGPVRIESMAGRYALETVTVAHIRFGGQVLRGLRTPVIRRQALGGVGLLGLDGLQGKRLSMDFRANRIEVRNDAEPIERPPTDSDNVIVVRARRKTGQMILVDCEAGERPVQVILDTGAQLSIGNMALLRKLRVDKLAGPPLPITLISVTGQAVAAQIAVVKMLRIGGTTIAGVPVAFLDAAPFSTLGLANRPAMLLGMQVLRLFDRIAIDFGRRRVDFLLADKRPEKPAREPPAL